MSRISRPSAHEISTPFVSVLSTWADLAETGPGGTQSAFALHARAAARHIAALEEVASAARALLAGEGGNDAVKTQLDRALHALNEGMAA